MEQSLLRTVREDPVAEQPIDYIPTHEGTYAALIAVLRHHAVSDTTDRACGWRMVRHDGVTIIDASTIRGTTRLRTRAERQRKNSAPTCGRAVTTKLSAERGSSATQSPGSASVGEQPSTSVSLPTNTGVVRTPKAIGPDRGESTTAGVGLSHDQD